MDSKQDNSTQFAGSTDSDQSEGTPKQVNALDRQQLDEFIESTSQKFINSVWMKHGNLFYAVFSNLSFAKMLFLFIFRKYSDILAWLDLDSIELAPKDFSLLYGHERQADLLFFARLRRPDGYQDDPDHPLPEDLGIVPIALLGEHKHQGSPGDPVEQLAVGTMGIHQRLKNNEFRQIRTTYTGLFWPVISFIFWHGWGKYPYSTNYSSLIFKTGISSIDRIQLSQESLLCDLNDYSRNRLWEEALAISKTMRQDEFVQANYPVFGCVLDLMQGIDGDKAEITNRAVEDFARLEPLTIDSHVTLVADLLMLYLQSAKSKIDQDELAKIRNDFQCRKGELMESLSYAQKLGYEAFDKGVAEGKAEGKVEGKAEGKAEAIVKYLKRTFGAVPQSICEAVFSKTDPIVLDSLLESAFDCSSLEEFERDL